MPSPKPSFHCLLIVASLFLLAACFGGSQATPTAVPPPFIAEKPTYQVRHGELISELNIILQQKADALWLPLQVVREFEGRYFVIVKDGDVERRVDVKVSIVGDDRIEITEGLAEGQVAVAP